MRETKWLLDAFVNGWPRKAVNQPRLSARKCDGKVFYETRGEADAAVIRYSKRVLFNTMTTYKCEIHECYHKGHDRFMSDEEELERTRMLVLAA